MAFSLVTAASFGLTQTESAGSFFAVISSAEASAAGAVAAGTTSTLSALST